MDDQAANQGGAGTIVVKPSSVFLTACETLNWIAFQQAVEGDLTGRRAIWQEFGYEPCLPPAVGGWDYVVAEAANVLQPEHRALMDGWTARFGREPKNLQAARDAAARFCADRNWPAINLHLYSIGRRELWSQRQRRLWGAQDKLAAALATERLTAHATRADASAASGRMGLPVDVPWRFFLARDAAIFPSGKITADGDPGYLDAKFRSAEVLAVWPDPDVAIPEVGEQGLPSTPSDAASLWMVSHVTECGTWKRDSAISECQRETGATYRASRDAWSALPESIRGKRGTRK